MASDTCLFQTLFQHEWCIHMTVSLSLSFFISRRNPLNYRIYLANSSFTSLYGISLSLQKNRLSALGNLNSISKVPLPVKCCIGPFSPKKKKKNVSFVWKNVYSLWSDDQERRFYNFSYRALRGCHSYLFKIPFKKTSARCFPWFQLS